MNLSSKSRDELIKEIERLLNESQSSTNHSTSHSSEESNNLSEVYWDSVFHNCPYQILIIDQKGIIINSNHLPNGASAASIKGMCAYDFIFHESRTRYINCVDRIFQSAKAETIELDGIGPGGSSRIYFSFLFPVVEKDNVTAVMVIIQDITEAKQRESRRKENELLIWDLTERYKRLSELSSEGVIIHDGQKILEVNEAACRILRFTEMELVGKAMADLVELSEGTSLERARESIANKSSVNYELEITRKDGEKIICQVEAKTTPYKNTEARVVVFDDITDKRRAERIVKETEDKYKKLSEATSEAVVIHENGIIVEVNHAVNKMWGYTDQELIGKVVFELVDPETAEFVKKNIREKKEGAFEIYITRKNGVRLLCECEGKEFRYDNSIARVVTFRDISGRRKAEELARENEDRFRRLSEASFEAVLIHESGKIIEFNETCCTMFGYSHAELNQMEAFDLAIEEDRRFLKQQSEKGVQRPYEATGLRKDGSTFFAEINAKTFRYKGKTARVVAIRDVSDRKESELKLQQVNEDYENLIRQSPDGIFILDEGGKILFANPGAYQIVGIHSLDEIAGQSIYNFISKEFHEQIRKRELLLQDGYDLPFIKIKANRINGSEVYVEYKPVIIDYQGKKAYMVVYHDIDFQEQLTKEKTRYKVAEETNRILKKEIEQRKKIGDKLKRSESEYKEQSAKLNAIIESSSHLVWVLDHGMKLSSFNDNFSKTMLRIYGSKPVKGVHMNKGKFISTPKYNDFWAKKCEEALKGKSQYFETNMTDKQGGEIWLEVYLNPIYGKLKKPVEISGIAHDITEKKLAEEKIKQSLKEKEVLLKEVHHRVKNNLQVISSILNLQSSYISDKKTVELLKESQNRIKSMSFIHESLYQTKDFSSVKFGEYVQNLSNNLLLSYKPKHKQIVLKQKIDEVFLNLDLAIPCGLIINELVSNALKYAFEKRKTGLLSISIGVDKKENVKMVISDNGSGLPEEIDYRNTQSLGLQLVMVLVSQLRGVIKLNNKQGAEFTITFNKLNVNQ